jgi:hypothetical protein
MARQFLIERPRREGEVHVTGCLDSSSGESLVTQQQGDIELLPNARSAATAQTIQNEKIEFGPCSLNDVIETVGHILILGPSLQGGAPIPSN